MSKNTNTTLPELSGDPRRQAIASISGTVYQAWCSIDAWLRLTTSDEVIYLEGAEDFDIVNTGGAIAVQIKHYEAPISLGTAKAREALENFWKLTTQDPTRQINFHYITTSKVVRERDATFGDINGIQAWRAAITNSEIAKQVASYIEGHLEENSELRKFLKSASPYEMQNKLYSRFHWITNQPGIEAVKKSVEGRIRVLLHQQKISTSLTPKVKLQLESYFWDLVVNKKSSERRLTLSDLLLQFEEATTTYLPISLDKIPDLLAGTITPGLRLLDLLKTKIPKPPAPLLQRSELVNHIENAVNQRRSILLTGTVFKGKTTLAQLVANNLTLDPWWINLTGRSADQVDNLLLALAEAIEFDSCPALIVIDDLDITPIAHHAYHDSLALVLHRLKASGRGILITAQGTSSSTELLSEFEGIEIFEIPELTKEEVCELCVQEGCLRGDAEFWGQMIHILTRGHPKLVQVRISELAGKKWPHPISTDFGVTSTAANSVRQLARQLLSATWPQEVLAFLYSASESTSLLHRSVIIKLAELVGGIQNPGDLLDNLSGSWIECVENDWFRTTSILNGAANDVWSPERRALAHTQLHDSFLSKGTLDPQEAAAILYHAYFGKEPRRISKAALMLQLINDPKAKDAVERNLLWLPYVALEDGQNLCDDIMASATLRGLQFKVAVTLDSNCLPEICARWIQETAQVQHQEMHQPMSVMMWSSIVMADNKKVPLIIRLNAILSLSGMQLDGKIADLFSAGFKSISEIEPHTGIPSSATQTQVMLVLCTRWVRSADALRELIEWLAQDATDKIRDEFDSLIEWSSVQTMGAFVQTAWSAEHEKVSEWSSWLDLFDFIDSFAKRKTLPALGREAAKAKAIILTEYLSKAQEALDVLSSAESSFGGSAVLDEQKANVLFQTNDDAQVLDVWNELVANPSNQFALDPFAYRRAAISAARLKNWGKAEEIFRDAIASIDVGSHDWTRFGLMVDCALTISLGGAQLKAAELLADAILLLPELAIKDGDPRWEASQRAASEVCKQVEDTLWNPSKAVCKFEPGYVSSPSLSVPECEAGQEVRSAMLRAMVAKLCGCLGVSTHLLDASMIESCTKSSNFFVRLLAAEALLAKSFSQGAGEDFIPAILKFDATFSNLENHKKEEFFLETAPENDQFKSPERWFGLLVAGALCSGNNMHSHLTSWLASCALIPGNLNGLIESIRQLQEGTLIPTNLLKQTINNFQNSPGLRCGAAIKSLNEPMQPEEVLKIQAFIASALVSDISYFRQEVYNHHVCVQFATKWEDFVLNPFNLPSPKTSQPIISQVIKNVRDGRGTLHTLLKTTAQVLDTKLGDFMDRVH